MRHAARPVVAALRQRPHGAGLSYVRGNAGGANRPKGLRFNRIAIGTEWTIRPGCGSGRRCAKPVTTMACFGADEELRTVAAQGPDGIQPRPPLLGANSSALL